MIYQSRPKGWDISLFLFCKQSLTASKESEAFGWGKGRIKFQCDINAVKRDY